MKLLQRILSRCGRSSFDAKKQIRKIIETLFDFQHQKQATNLIGEVTNTGGGGQAAGRCEIAALKVSDGDIERLKWAVDLYHTDFRDLLMSAGFGHDTSAHKKWKPNRK